VAIGGSSGLRDLPARLQFAQQVPFDFVAEFLFDVVHARHLVAADQAEGPAFLVDAPGAADAMDMDFGIGRDVDVDHGFELVDVEAARGDVGGDQHRATAVGELDQHLVALALLHLAVQRHGDEALGAQYLQAGRGTAGAYCRRPGC
jgi:hypothetical protein